MGMKKIDEAFKIVCNLFRQYEIPFWLEAGSLLGAVREGKRIEWDEDYDIAYYIKYASKILQIIKQVEQYGFKVHGNLYHSISYKGKHLICIQPHRLIRGHMYRVKSILPTEYHLNKLPMFLQRIILVIQMRLNRKMYYRGSFYDYNILYPIPMGKEYVHIPVGFDKILTRKYGNWRVPNVIQNSENN